MTSTPDNPAAPPGRSPSPPVGDGREDFDFLFGRWHVANRKLTEPLDPACTTWAEFDAVAAAGPILHGLGNFDSFNATAGADGSPFQGVTLRLFDPQDRTWRIWWAATTRPGYLKPPMEGRFNGCHGVFNSREKIAGQAVDVRFDWHVSSPVTARWEQAFCLDDGQTWVTNWVMDLTRGADSVPASP